MVPLSAGSVRSVEVTPLHTPISISQQKHQPPPQHTSIPVFAKVQITLLAGSGFATQVENPACWSSHLR